MDKEYNNMGSIDSGTAATLALLTDTARAGRYGGYYGGGGGEGGGYGGYGSFAGPSANAVRINRNSEVTKLGIDRISDQNEENRRNSQNMALVDRLDRNFNRVSDKITDGEFRTGDRLRDIEREVNANAKAAAECCCETQKEILKLDASNSLKFAELGKDLCNVESKLTAEVRAVEGRTIQRDLDRAERRVTQLEILSQCGCGCGGGTRPCPPQNGG